ncbi:hypothetical protein C1752_00583 [Acaryochloris thomasi RCC1774]|uniref:Regulator of phycobilisome association C n=1 Tax=Acaryochloris thomasi RCC1774 TaxID=1764569 RepID=A0A2W1JNU7_9CYAN|nr:hypothetical protein [Acaryochloris thomasi]PZD74906.1 hypothetical protein C1752_00583 [Acaryochloris thomasi RCC1774]
MNPLQGYQFRCTLTFGDIYAQVIIWLIVIFLSLATSVAMYQNPVYAFLTGGLILVLSLPFLLFAFVTTLLNHIQLSPVEETKASGASADSTPPSGAVQTS